MSESKVYPVKAHISNGALLDKEGYEAMYQASVQDPDAFWGEQGKILDWMTPYTRVKNTSYDPGHVSIKWYEDGLLNVSANCTGSPSERARRQGRHHLGRGQPG
jgi:acetyl-CoA synthetase